MKVCLELASVNLEEAAPLRHFGEMQPKRLLRRHQVDPRLQVDITFAHIHDTCVTLSSVATPHTESSCSDCACLSPLPCVQAPIEVHAHGTPGALHLPWGKARVHTAFHGRGR
jgi:hypothetical protein